MAMPEQVCCHLEAKGGGGEEWQVPGKLEQNYHVASYDRPPPHVVVRIPRNFRWGTASCLQVSVIVDGVMVARRCCTKSESGCLFHATLRSNVALSTMPTGIHDETKGTSGFTPMAYSTSYLQVSPNPRDQTELVNGGFGPVIVKVQRCRHDRYGLQLGPQMKPFGFSYCLPISLSINTRRDFRSDKNQYIHRYDPFEIEGSSAEYLPNSCEAIGEVQEFLFQPTSYDQVERLNCVRTDCRCQKPIKWHAKTQPAPKRKRSGETDTSRKRRKRSQTSSVPGTSSSVATSEILLSSSDLNQLMQQRDDLKAQARREEAQLAEAARRARVLEKASNLESQIFLLQKSWTSYGKRYERYTRHQTCMRYGFVGQLGFG